MTSLAQYYTIVVGFFAILMIGLTLFIHYLRVGLNSHDAVVIDPKPTTSHQE